MNPIKHAKKEKSIREQLKRSLIYRSPSYESEP